MLKNQKLVDFEKRIGELKRLKRTGWVIRNVPNPETVASHSWRMALMAIQKEKELKQLGCDVDRIVEMCLLHDFGEVVIGDIVPECHQNGENRISKEEKKKLEMKAIEKLAEEYDFLKLKEVFIEYEAQDTLEAKVVKNIDKVDMLLQAYEYKKSYPEIKGLDEFMECNEQDVNLSIFVSEIQEIKERQYNNNTKPNLFIDTQMLLGKLKHLEMIFSQEKESFAVYNYGVALRLLYQGEELKKRGIDIYKCVRLALIYNISKVLGDVSLSILKESFKNITEDVVEMKVVKNFCF